MFLQEQSEFFRNAWFFEKGELMVEITALKA